MNLLVLDTATEKGSVTLVVSEEKQTELLPKEVRHSEIILSVIDQLLIKNGLTLKNINAIAFSQGPGGFMGLRVGAAISQGLAYGLDIPVIGISTLSALAQQAYRCYGAKNCLIALDARMGEVYWNAFSVKANTVTPLLEDQLSHPKNAFLNIDSKKPWFCFGSGWSYHKEIPMLISQDTYYEQGALSLDVAHLALLAFSLGHVVSPEQVLPVYLRNKVALTQKERQANLIKKSI